MSRFGWEGTKIQPKACLVGYYYIIERQKSKIACERHVDGGHVRDTWTVRNGRGHYTLIERFLDLMN